MLSPFFVMTLPEPKQQISDASKLKVFADDNFKIVKKFSKWVENDVINRDGQFLLFPQCFQKTCTVDTKKEALVQ